MRILILAGPTASGKTALSLHAARVLDGETINADSMQLYRGLPVISAQPSDDEKRAAPHHMFSVLEPSQRCSVGQWSRMALDRIEAVESRGCVPILVGGTGLYFKALLEGLAPIPEIPEPVLAEVDALFQTRGLEGLKAEAEAVDPVATTRIADGDRQRLMRVVAVARATGKPLSQLQADTQPLIDPAQVHGVVIQPDREALYHRIETRFDRMVEAGALEEAAAMAERNLAPDLPAMKAVGLPPLLAHLRGELTLEAAIEIAKRDSRRYAKRQFTWFSNQHGDWPRISALDPADQQGELDHILSRSFGKGAQ
ncbi:tRNA (adenosine(37)-N6)-dimethylallyltransferase MiaA [Maricaulaceae bacterium NA33B04]|nr:tRNA (adenosine(37)-N6)-dimethylallyltransferase MiaA [Maricaulaceae bacterium NA33B04]